MTPIHPLSKLAVGICDPDVHRLMVKYGRGSFRGPRVSIAVRGKSLHLSSDFGYENLLGWLFVRFTSDKRYSASGRLVSYEDVSEELERLNLPLKGRRSKGVFEYPVKGTLDKRTLAGLYELALRPGFFAFLDVKSVEGQLKTKKRFPQPTSEREPVDFCKVRMPTSKPLLLALLKELTPDFQVNPPLKRLTLKNTFIIREIILPENREKLSSRELRLASKRKGVLVRELEVDGRLFKREQPFTC